MRWLVMVVGASLALAGCGGENSEDWASRASATADDLCRSLTDRELARAFDTSARDAKREAARRAVASALIESENDFVIGASERPTKEELATVEEAALVMCELGAERRRAVSIRASE